MRIGKSVFFNLFLSFPWFKESLRKDFLGKLDHEDLKGVV